MRVFHPVLLVVLLPVSALAQERTQTAEEAIRAAIGEWYEELGKGENGNVRAVVGHPFIAATPYYRHVDTGAAALGPRVYVSLAAQALKFAYDVESVRIDPNFARAQVWERGYFYAFAAGKTYERAAATDFILERREDDGRWLIVGYQSGSYGIPPGKKTDPMPDMRDLYFEKME